MTFTSARPPSHNFPNRVIVLGFSHTVKSSASEVGKLRTCWQVWLRVLREMSVLWSQNSSVLHFAWFFWCSFFSKSAPATSNSGCWEASPWKVRWEPHEYAPLPAQPWRSSFLYQAVTVVTGPKDNESHRHLGHSHELKGLQCWCTCNTLLSDCTEKKGGTQNIQNLVS